MLQNCINILVLFLQGFTLCSSHNNLFSQIPYFIRELRNMCLPPTRLPPASLLPLLAPAGNTQRSLGNPFQLIRSVSSDHLTARCALITDGSCIHLIPHSTVSYATPFPLVTWTPLLRRWNSAIVFHPSNSLSHNPYFTPHTLPMIKLSSTNSAFQTVISGRCLVVGEEI